MRQLIENYRAAKERVEKNAELKKRIVEFQRLNADIQKNANTTPLSFEDEKLISSQYWALMLNDDARCFFESERELVAHARFKMEEICDGIYLGLSVDCELMPE